ncbi:MAG: methyltransferase domain-containing protein [Pirellulales bacterium]|nr:methyltransferase domain-containing protein [Pirellulales bacterium]
MMFPRNRQPEWMDDPGLPKEDHRRALLGLSRLNRFSGVAGAMYRRLRRYVAPGQNDLRVLDVASGAGDIPIAWARRAAQDGITMRITALDISDTAAEEQQRRAHLAGVEIESAVQDCLKQPLPAGHDVITCSLFMHHLDDRSTLMLLQAMQMAAERAMVICDLDRSRINLALVGVASRLLTRSPVVHTDALLSVRGAYTRQEFKALAEEALLRPVQIHRSFPCRFIVTVDEATAPVAVPSFA